MDNEEIIKELIKEETEEEVTEEVIEEVEEEIEQPMLLASENSTGDYDLQILEELQKSNQNWDLFLDSFEVVTVSPLDISSLGFNRYVANYKFVADSNAHSYYIPCSAGVTYHFTFSQSGGSFMQYSLLFVTSLPRDQYYDNLGGVNLATLTTDNRFITGDFVAPTNGYFIFGYRYNDVHVSITFDSISYDSYTLSEIGNAITSVSDKVNGLDTIVTIETSLLLVTLFTFFLSAVRKFGKKANRKGDL